jgi:hypothetical protein
MVEYLEEIGKQLGVTFEVFVDDKADGYRVRARPRKLPSGDAYINHIKLEFAGVGPANNVLAVAREARDAYIKALREEADRLEGL